MHDGEILVPIIMFLVIGMVLSLYFYFRSKDRQLIIEKGMSPDIVKTMFKYKWNPYLWLKLGIVTAFGSLGVLIGNYLMWAFPLHRYFNSGEKWVEENPAMMVFSIFFMVGVGFVAAFYVARKTEREEDERSKRNQE